MINLRAAQSCALHPTDNKCAHSDIFLTLTMILYISTFLMTLNSFGPFNISFFFIIILELPFNFHCVKQQLRHNAKYLSE